MHRIAFCSLLTAALYTLAAGSSHAGEPEDATIQAVPVTEEPLHVIRHRGEHFMIYTNWIEPGVWTLYHQHRNDLLAVIAADTSAASQIPGSEPRGQTAPAGTVVFFPYTDDAAAYVHRVGASGEAPFINIGLEFRDPLVAACAGKTPTWDDAHVERLAPNRRGQAYRLTLAPGAEAALPQDGRGLLLVPLGQGALQVDEDTWNSFVGDFRFYDNRFPQRLHNSGPATATLVVFDAC